jgi:hypothetical protein
LYGWNLRPVCKNFPDTPFRYSWGQSMLNSWTLWRCVNDLPHCCDILVFELCKVYRMISVLKLNLSHWNFQPTTIWFSCQEPFCVDLLWNAYKKTVAF